MLALLLTLLAAASSLSARQYFRPFSTTSLQKWSPRPISTVRETTNATHTLQATTITNAPDKMRDLKDLLKEQNPPMFHISAQGTVWRRGAHETFGSTVGTTTEPLSALMFGKSSFRLSQIFQNCLVPLSTKNYNPYMRIFKMHPRITYQEAGIDMSFNIESRMRTFKNTRIGVRVKTPLIRREIERKDAGWRASEQVQDVYTLQKHMIKNSDSTPTGKEITVPAYRLDFLEATKQTALGTSMIGYSSNGITLASTPITKSNNSKIPAVLVSSPEGIVPREQNMIAYNPSEGSANTSVTAYLPNDLTTLSSSQTYQVSDTISYENLSDTATITVTQRIADQDAKAQTWVVPTFTYTSSPQQSLASLFSSMNADKRETYANQYEWLFDRDYHLESSQATGIGNTTIEGYLAYDLNRNTIFELSGGMVVPTATGHLEANNPYLVHLGNRNHLEAFLGGGFMYKPFKLLQVSSDTRFNMVFRGQEQRTATPVGALVKNIGAPTTAQVRWNYVTSDLAFTVFHPKTQTISLTAGYNFYYKTEDDITFDTPSIDSWLGKTYNNTDYDYTIANVWQLDEAVAQMRTESCAHTVRLQANYSISRLMHLYGSGSYVIVGKNTPQDFSVALGCTVTF